MIINFIAFETTGLQKIDKICSVRCQENCATMDGWKIKIIFYAREREYHLSYIIKFKNQGNSQTYNFNLTAFTAHPKLDFVPSNVFYQYFCRYLHFETQFMT